MVDIFGGKGEEVVEVHLLGDEGDGPADAGKDKNRQNTKKNTLATNSMPKLTHYLLYVYGYIITNMTPTIQLLYALISRGNML